MQVLKLSTMTKGWFIGDFTPTVHRTQDFEVAVKSYRAGDAEAPHFHKIAREFTVVVSGTVRMNGQIYGPGDIVVIEAGEASDFHVLTDAVTTVVKVPGAPNDKYPA